MAYVASLLFGVAVGVAYGFAGVKSPAPPIVALFGLLGMVLGEQGAGWLKKQPWPSQAVARGADQPTSPTRRVEPVPLKPVKEKQP